jgi:3-dehydroquinate dehydratase-1
MKNVQVKNVVFNDSLPKICVPVTCISESEILDNFNELNNTDIDLAELRADYFEFARDRFKVISLLEKIRKLYHKPLLFTLRTKKEGGASEITADYYFELNNSVIEGKLADMIDIEFFSQPEEINHTIDLAGKNQVKTILSSHDFLKTPSAEEIITILNKMINCGDIAKIAVMPNSEEDVLTLLSASLKLKKEKKGPFIAIAMGPLGIISRISCELFGSCMTYASHKDKSAPGQVDYKLTKEILKIMHS